MNNESRSFIERETIRLHKVYGNAKQLILTPWKQNTPKNVTLSVSVLSELLNKQKRTYKRKVNKKID